MLFSGQEKESFFPPCSGNSKPFFAPAISAISNNEKVNEIAAKLSETPVLHLDQKAIKTTHNLGARGVAYRNEIAIDHQRYRPGTPKFDQLLAHELTHVQQYQENKLGPSRENEANAAEQKAGGQTRHQPSINTPHHLSLTPDRIEAFHLDLTAEEIYILLDDGTRITGQVRHSNLRAGRYQVHWDSSQNGLVFAPWPSNEEVIQFDITGTMAFLHRYAQLRQRISAAAPVTFTVRSNTPDQNPEPETNPTEISLQQRIEPTADAFAGIHLFPAIDPADLPATDGVDFGTEFTVGDYLVVPQIRRLPDRSRQVAYYIAYNNRSRRNEFLVGPNQITQFRQRISLYTNIAAIAYMTIPRGEQPPMYLAESWRAQTAFLAGDMDGYGDHLAQSWREVIPESEEIFQRIISGLRDLQRQGVSQLRAQANELPEAERAEALEMVRAVEAISDILIRLILAVVGIISGAIDALINMVIGLFRLLVGILEGILLFLYGFIDGGERFDRWAREVEESLSNLIPALRATVDRWLTEFEQASEDRQTIMIGELTGELLATIATFGATASRAGAAPNIIARIERTSPNFAIAGGRQLAFETAAVEINVAAPAAATAITGTAAMRIREDGDELPEGTHTVTEEPPSGASDPPWVDAPEPVQALQRFARTQDPMEAFVYRIRNADGDVIYYGISTDPISRLRGHIRSQRWAHEIDHIEVINQPFRRPQALALESDLIREARAQGNRIYNQVDDTVRQGLGGRRGSHIEEIEVPSPSAPWVSIER